MISELLTEFSTVSFEGLVTLLQEHQMLVSVLVPFFAGELSIHLFGILYGSGDISLMPAIIAMVSILFFDVVIYSVVRTVMRSKSIINYFQKKQFFAKCEKFFKDNEKKYRKNQTLLLIAVKLMPMTKVTLIFFALSQKMSLLRFIVRDAIITVVWVALIFSSGWLVGKELVTAETGRQLSNFILYFILLIVLLLLFGKQIDRLIMRAVDKIASMMDNSKQIG